MVLLSSGNPASSATVLNTPKATSLTLYFDSLTVNAGNGGFLHCIQMDFFFQAEDGIRDLTVTGVQTCALPILHNGLAMSRKRRERQPLALNSWRRSMPP